MNKPLKLRVKEVVFLLLPIAGLLVWSFRIKDPQPFKLVVDEVQVTLLPKSSSTLWKPGNRKIKAVVFLNHEGSRPFWWSRMMSGGGEHRVHFTAKNEKDDLYTNIGAYSGFDYDQSTERYKFDYHGEIPKGPHFLKESTCHITASLASSRPPFPQVASVKASIPGHKLVRK